ncbi:MAG: hypothetical protein H0V53_14110, partial [Rubrobacter sp.]|nr:hypothetical protein [Rubrobacter sp.]
MSGKRVTVDEAARVLGLSVDAIRKRVQRGTIAHEKDAAGRVHIMLDDYSTLQDSSETSSSELVEQLRSENAYLRDQLEQASTRDRENRRLLAAALERMPELEAPPAAADEAESAGESARGAEDPGESAEPEAATSQRRSW